METLQIHRSNGAIISSINAHRRHGRADAPNCKCSDLHALCLCLCVSLRLHVSAYKIQSQCVQHARKYRSDHSHELTDLSFCLSGFRACSNIFNNKLLIASRCNSGGNSIFLSSKSVQCFFPPAVPVHYLIYL